MIAATASATLALLTSSVAAEPARIRVQLDSTLSCPAGRIYSEVTARSPRIDVEPAVRNADRRRIGDGAHRVLVRPGGGAFSAHIEIELDQGQQVVRELSAKDCEELSAAIGFVVAVTLDPPHRRAATPARAETPAPAPVPPPQTVKPTPAGEDPSQALWVEIGGGAQMEQGVAPFPLIGVVLSMGLAGPTPEGGGFGWPSVRAGFSYSIVRYAQEEGSARFQLAGADLTVSPAEYHLGRLNVRPGAFVTEAVLTAAGLGVDSPNSKSLRWLVFGGSLEARLTLGPGWLLSLLGGVGRTVKQYQFQFEPQVFHSVPAWVGRGSVGLGRRF